MLYAVSTAEVVDTSINITDLATIASDVAWDAVLSSIPDLDPVVAATPATLNDAEYQQRFGTFDLGAGARVSIRRDGNRLLIESQQGAGIYVPRGQAVALEPVTKDLFLLDTNRRDRLQFIRRPDGSIEEIMINPGWWGIRGRRMR
jgi:hypothetical protein